MSYCPINGNPCLHAKNHHITEIVDGESQQFKLCGLCANVYFNEHQKPEKNKLINFLPEAMIDALNAIKLENAIRLGKVPVEEETIASKRKTIYDHYEKMKSNIENAIKEERFEDAIIFRDELKKTNSLKKQMEQLTDKFQDFISRNEIIKAAKIEKIIKEVIEMILKKINPSL